MDAEKAEAYLNAAANPAGRVVINDIKEDFDKAMRAVLKCPEEELQTRRGEARALEKILERFDSATKVMEARRKHGAT
jgi:hypothetical protein